MKATCSQNQKSKKMAYTELLLVAFFLIAFLADIQVLILGCFVLACLLVVVSDRERSIYYLAFFTSFAGIFVYQGRHMFFVMAALFIGKFLLCNRVNKTTLLFYFLIVLYCLCFCDFGGDFTFSKMMGAILLLVIPVITSNSDEFDSAEFMKHYIFGFAISTIIGFFVREIPAMIRLFEYDLLWTEDYIEVTRFFGLAYDSNFYALSNYVIVAYLLFAFKNLDWFRSVLIVFFVFAGLQTVSKSYFLILCVLLICYFVKSMKSIKQLLWLVSVAVVGIFLLICTSNLLGYNIIDLVTERFIQGGTFADNTTGRVDIWKEYGALFVNSGIKETLFGFGFNATVVHAAHNTIIDFLFHYGIVGTIMWLLYFIHCKNLLQLNVREFEHRSSMVLLCFGVGCFFLSAYTYEAFWMGLLVTLLTYNSLAKRMKGGA